MTKLKISRRVFLKIFSLSTIVTTLPIAITRCQNQKRKPNVLLILTDDQGWGDITSHGNPLIDTPVLNRIAISGARFDRFYVSPVCSPTRASLLTGRYHSRSGVQGVTRGKETMRSKEITIAEILKDNDYATGCYGKWHNGAHYPNHPNGQGFDEFLGFCAGHWNNYFDTTLEYNGNEFRSKGYIADVFTDAAIDFMKKHKNEPFFCYIPYNPPHSPFQVPDKYFNKYKSRGLDDTLACVYAMCENLDDNIGKLLKTLESLHLIQNTIVIFITDNGPNTERFNGNMRGRKGSVHEGGTRVPCFISWPGKIAAGKVVKKIAAHIDILPTLIDLVGIEKPLNLQLDGLSLVKLLENGEQTWQDRLLFTVWNNRGAVRSQKYRLTIENKKIELYDMEIDPEEKNDISTEKPQITRQFKLEYDRWLEQVSKDGYDHIPIAIGHEEWPDVVLPGHEAFLHAPEDKGISYVGKQGWANDWITNWTSRQAYPYWEVDIIKNGYYEITLMYSCRPEDLGSQIQIQVGDVTIRGSIDEAHNPDFIYSPDRVKRKEVYEKVWASLLLGRTKLNKGRTQLVIRAIKKPGQYVMDLKEVHIRAVN